MNTDGVLPFLSEKEDGKTQTYGGRDIYLSLDCNSPYPQLVFWFWWFGRSGVPFPFFKVLVGINPTPNHQFGGS